MQSEEEKRGTEVEILENTSKGWAAEVCPQKTERIIMKEGKSHTHTHTHTHTHKSKIEE